MQENIEFQWSVGKNLQWNIARQFFIILFNSMIILWLILFNYITYDTH